MTICVDRPDKAADGAARRTDIEAVLDDVGRLPDEDIDLAGGPGWESDVLPTIEQCVG